MDQGRKKENLDEHFQARQKSDLKETEMLNLGNK